MSEEIACGNNLLSAYWQSGVLIVILVVQDIGWYWFGRSLAVANLVYFSINLFGFLIPQFLPKAFEIYFRERDEIHSKTAEDKRSAAADNTQVTDKKADESQVTDKKSD